MTRIPSSSAYDLALRLLRREGASDDSGSDAIAAAADRVLRRLQSDLVQRFGDEGFRALLLRSLERMRPGYPALAGVIPRREGGGLGTFSLDGLFENVQLHSPDECLDAFLAVIAAMITLLGRLVGDDVATRLVAYDSPDSISGEPRSTDE